MIELIQVLAIIIAVFAISRALFRLKKRKISLSAFMFWCVLWVAVVIVAFIPGVTAYFSDIFGVRRGIDFIVYLSIILLFYMIFRVYVKLENISQQITKITRELAIQRKKKKK